MTLHTQVVVLPDTLDAIATCIEDAWAQTRQQVDDVGYHNLIQQTAFAQFLVANVSHQVYQLNDAFPGISASLRSNKTRHRPSCSRKCPRYINWHIGSAA